MNAADLISSQMQQLFIQQITVGLSPGSTTLTNQSSYVHTMQLKTQKGTQQPKDNKKRKGNNGGGDKDKKKRKGKNGGGDKDKKPKKNSKGAKDEKRKVKFPCKLCGDDHLTHQFPKMEEAQQMINLQQQQQQQPAVLKNPFLQGQHM